MKKIRCWSGPTERPGWPAIPIGRAGQTNTLTGAQRRVDGRLSGVDRCPTESAMGARRRARWVPDGGRDGCLTEGGSRGWPDGGVYKCC
jgi:hypothetical protein